MSRIAPWHQTNWDWRAAGNFIGGGTGTGLMIVAAILASEGMPFKPLALAALAFVAAGLACVWMEIGQPLRALNVFKHPQTSWMTREAMVAPVLFLTGLAAALMGGGPMAWVAALAAAAFLYCQGRILFASKGIPAWRQPAIVPLILATGLAEGAGAAAVVVALVPGASAPRWLYSGLFVLLILRTVLWRTYTNQLAASGAPIAATRVLARLDTTFLTTGNGVPALIAIAAWMLGGSKWVGALAGLMALGGGWALKFTVVARAAYNQGFALPKLPVRGQGTPGPGVKPGWIPPMPGKRG